MLRSKLTTFLLAFSLIIALSLIAFPQESVSASVRGLNMWLNIVFPSLLPFFIISEVLIGFGVVKFIGVLLEPFMRPLFRVPGVGGFAWAMGMASGFPAGAKITARLRQEGQITRIEAERLASFTNSSNPLFIFGAVAVGFFQNASLGVILALAHYLGNITVGFMMRFYGKEGRQNHLQKTKKSNTLKTALSVLHHTRLKDNRTIGKLLGDAVMSSVQTLLMIGGFIILFSVINKLLFHLNITPFIAKGIGGLFDLLLLPVELSLPFISGIFEITLGSQLVSQIKDVPLMEQAIITSLILGFSGLSVQAQVASILAQTDIRFKPFFFARILHGIIAAIYTFILWKPIYLRFYANDEPASTMVNLFTQDPTLFYSFMIQSPNTGSLITIGMLAIYVVVYAKRINTLKRY